MDFSGPFSIFLFFSRKDHLLLEGTRRNNTDVITFTVLHQLITQLPQPYIITGDFNAHNIIWVSNHTNNRGAVIESFFTETDIILLNTGAPTHFNVYNGNTSSIDLSLCSPNIAQLLYWSTCSNLYSSDHCLQSK